MDLPNGFLNFYTKSPEYALFPETTESSEESSPPKSSMPSTSGSDSKLNSPSSDDDTVGNREQVPVEFPVAARNLGPPPFPSIFGNMDVDQRFASWRDPRGTANLPTTASTQNLFDSGRCQQFGFGGSTFDWSSLETCLQREHFRPSRLLNEPMDLQDRKVFDFTSGAPRPSWPLGSSVASPPKLHIFSDRKINFVNAAVPFVIQVFNPPAGVQLHPRMFRTAVHTPDGKFLYSRVRSSDSYIINSFTGSFNSTQEMGPYKVQVKLVVPVEQSGRRRIIAQGYSPPLAVGSTQINISKNYGLDAYQDSLRIKCDFMVRDKAAEPSTSVKPYTSGSLSLAHSSSFRYQQPERHCKLWGLTCNLYNNNILYADREANTISCVSPNGDLVFKFGDGNNVPEGERLCRPTGICFDSIHSRLIVCDKDKHRICFFTLDGEFIESFGKRGHENGSFEYPWDVTVAPNGSIVISDSKNKRVQLFDPYGNYLNKYTVFEVNPFVYRAQFDYPRGVVVDESGQNLFVSDFNINNIIRIPMDFSTHQKILPHGTILRPQGLACDSVGNLLVTDSRHDCIRHMTPRGEYLSTIREIVKEPVRFPLNVTTMAGGYVAVLNALGNITIF